MTKSPVDTSERETVFDDMLSPTEFVDLIFEELGDKWKYKRARTINYSAVLCSDYWREKIIPCVTELYEMAQTDSTVFEFFVVFLSQFDIGKESSKDFGTQQIFGSLVNLKAWQSRSILSRIKGASEQDINQLQRLLEDNNLEDFRRVLRRTKNYHSIVDFCSVLSWFDSLKLIYAYSIKEPDNDSLGKLFLLIEQYIHYFSFLYHQNNRLCDGIIYDFLCILNRTRNCKYGDKFCEVSKYIGECFITGLILFYCMYKNWMPIEVRDVLSDVVLYEYCNHLDLLYPKFNNCNTDEEKSAFLKEVGSDMETNFYRFLYKYMDQELAAQKIPLMQELSTAIVEHPFINPFLLGTIQPVLSKSEEATVQETRHIREPYVLPGQIFLYNDDFSKASETIILDRDKKKIFLERLADALCNDGFISDEDKEIFIYAFSNRESSSIDETKMINWKKAIADLLGLCCVLFNDEIFDAGKWPKIAEFFLANGKPLGTSNASRYRYNQHRYNMQKIVKRILAEI